MFETFANSADPDETPQHAASDQGPRCLLLGLSIKNKINSDKVHQTPLKLEMDSSS